MVCHTGLIKKFLMNPAAYEFQDFNPGFKVRVMKIEHLKLQLSGAGHREAKIHLAKWVFKHRVMKIELYNLHFGERDTAG